MFTMVFKFLVISGLAIGAITTAEDALALTIPSGHVITTDGQVIPAGQSANTQRQIDQNGYAIAGGSVHVRIGGETVSVRLNELAGQSRERIVEIIGDAAIEQGVDLGSVDVTDINTNDVAQDLIDAGASLEEVQAITDQIELEQIAEVAGQAVADALTDDAIQVIQGNDGSYHCINCPPGQEGRLVQEHIDNQN